MDTLSQVRQDVCQFVGDSGTCADDPRVLAAINDVRRILYPIGDWKDTVESLCIKPDCGRVTLPPEFDYAKAARWARMNVVVENDWFSRGNDLLDYCGRPCEGFVKEHGTYSTFREFPSTPTKGGCKSNCPPNGYRLKVVFESEADCGAELIFHVFGVNRRHLSLTRTSDGAWRDNLGGPTDEWIVGIRYVVKPVTQGRIRVYGSDGANPDVLIALYDPDVVNPQMSRYRVGRMRGSVILKAKKKYVPLTDGNQPVDISTEAIIHGLQAITDRKSRNVALFSANIKLATDFLNRELAGPESTSTTPMRMSSAYHVSGLIE